MFTTERQMAEYRAKDECSTANSSHTPTTDEIINSPLMIKVREFDAENHKQTKCVIQPSNCWGRGATGRRWLCCCGILFFVRFGLRTKQRRKIKITTESTISQRRPLNGTWFEINWVVLKSLLWRRWQQNSTCALSSGRSAPLTLQSSFKRTNTATLICLSDSVFVNELQWLAVCVCVYGWT